MAKFEITILGCGSAVPTQKHLTSAQLVNVDDRLFLVDCGEGTQTQVYKYGLKLTNLDAVFISHMHGDHFFGLLPLLSSLGLMFGRTDNLQVYVPQEMVEPLEHDLIRYCHLPYKVVLHAVDTTSTKVLFENRTMTVESVPLEHRVPCMGFVFREKNKSNVLLLEKCKQYGIPYKEFGRIKDGADYVMPDGQIVSNAKLTKKSDYVPRSYAYISDTAYFPALVPQIKEVDLLYHEATFVERDVAQAVATAHSTAQQAASIAKEANVKQLAIGHYSIRYDNEDELLAEAMETFPNTVASQEGMVFKL
jgi:ribonuclease Z